LAGCYAEKCRKFSRLTADNTGYQGSGETQNLYADARHASVVSNLAGEIHRWQESAKDKLKL
jgi:hypothetical protein